MEKLEQRDIILKSRYVTLRPPTQEDWDVMLEWNDDLEFQYYSVGDDSAGYKLEHLQQLYHGEDREKFHFVIEFEEKPVGGCWLHEMDLQRIIQQFPDLDCRRIGLFLAERDHWDQGVGTEVVRILTEFGFEHEDADAIFTCDISGDDVQTIRAFERNGYIVLQKLLLPEWSKGKVINDFILMRETYDDRSIS